MKRRRGGLPDGASIVFGGMCLLGVVVGLLSGAGKISQPVYLVIVIGLPIVFTVWAAASLDPARLGEITGHTAWRGQAYGAADREEHCHPDEVSGGEESLEGGEPVELDI